MSRVNVSYMDYDRERSTASIEVIPMTAENFDATNAAINTLISAIDAITLGVNVKKVVIASETEAPGASPPANPFAQRETKWLVRYHDVVTSKKYSLEIPTADLGGSHLVANTERANLSDTDIAAFVAAFETVARSPDNPANDVAVDEIIFVSRDL